MGNFLFYLVVSMVLLDCLFVAFCVCIKEANRGTSTALLIKTKRWTKIQYTGWSFSIPFYRKVTYIYVGKETISDSIPNLKTRDNKQISIDYKIRYKPYTEQEKAFLKCYTTLGRDGIYTRVKELFETAIQNLISAINLNTIYEDKNNLLSIVVSNTALPIYELGLESEFMIECWEINETKFSIFNFGLELEAERMIESGKTSGENEEP